MAPMAAVAREKVKLKQRKRRLDEVAVVALMEDSMGLQCTMYVAGLFFISAMG